jgi:hypothetical protein
VTFGQREPVAACMPAFPKLRGADAKKARLLASLLRCGGALGARRSGAHRPYFAGAIVAETRDLGAVMLGELHMRIAGGGSVGVGGALALFGHAAGKILKIHGTGS